MPPFAVPNYSPSGSETSAPAPAPPQPPVVVKKYANRRLYNTETSSYITLDNLADMIRAGRDFVVYDAKSGEDITRGVLTQIIVEEESKGTSMLPTAFLRQLIGFYGGSLQGVVPRYLEQAMSTFARQQQQLRQVVQQTFSPFMPVSVEEVGRQNVAMIERAMSMFNPFHRGSEPLPPNQAPQPAMDATPPSEHGPDLHDVERLQREIESLRTQLAVARAETVLAHTPAVPDAVTPPAPAAESSVVAEPVPAAPLRTARRERVAKAKNNPE
jgi:polyhydroxyalkanoate synthesis repressor PhaR